MKIKFSKVLDFDDQKEESRLRECFEGKQLARQLNLLELFRTYKWDDFMKFYNNLPYSKEDHCSEKEFICEFMVDFIWEYYLTGYKVEKV